jgi:tetratricopeptide (TPR) repeat protein
MVVGRYEEALSLLEQSKAIATSLRDGVRLQYIAQARAYSLMQLGRLQEAEQQLDESLHWARLTGVNTHSSLALKANLRRLQRDYENALELIQQAEQANDPLSQSFILEIRGLIERDRGDLWAARRFMERALQQRERDGDLFRLHFARTHRAHLDCKLGEPHAVDELMACLDYWRAQENSPWIATTLLYLAEAQIAAGQTEAARASLAEALQRNRAMGRTLHVAACCELQAVLEAMEGSAGDA